MTPSGHSAARRKLSGISIHSCLAEGSPGKVHLIHSNQEAADTIFLTAVNDCRRRDLLAFEFTESCEKRKWVPQRFQGEQEAWCNLASGFSTQGPFFYS